MRTSSKVRTQPTPSTPSITKRMVRQHARLIYRDTWDRRPLTEREWRLAEQDLVRTLEAEAF